MSEAFWTQRLAFSSQTGEHPLLGALTPEVPLSPTGHGKGSVTFPECVRSAACVCVCFSGDSAYSFHEILKAGMQPRKARPTDGVGASPQATVWSRAGPMGGTALLVDRSRPVTVMDVQAPGSEAWAMPLGSSVFCKLGMIITVPRPRGLS